MAVFAPRFCSKHLKIHICEDLTVTVQLETAENDISAKVRRMHGIQTEEDISKVRKKIRSKVGGFENILTRAKKTIEKNKRKLGLKNEAEIGSPISKEQANDRMNDLKNRILGISPPTPPKIKKQASKPRTTKKVADGASKPPKPTPKATTATKTSVKKKTEQKLFTEKETQDLIEHAVRIALDNASNIIGKKNKK